MTALDMSPILQLEPRDPRTKHPEGNFRVSWTFPHQNDLPQPTAFYSTKMPALACMVTRAGFSTYEGSPPLMTASQDVSPLMSFHFHVPLCCPHNHHLPSQLLCIHLHNYLGIVDVYHTVAAMYTDLNMVTS